MLGKFKYVFPSGAIASQHRMLGNNSEEGRNNGMRKKIKTVRQWISDAEKLKAV